MTEHSAMVEMYHKHWQMNLATSNILYQRILRDMQASTTQGIFDIKSYICDVFYTTISKLLKEGMGIICNSPSLLFEAHLCPWLCIQGRGVLQ
jgi:hypothetical protein